MLFYSCACLFVSQVPGFEVDVAWSALRRDAFEGEPPGDKGVGKVSQTVSLSVSYSRERERERYGSSASIYKEGCLSIYPQALDTSRRNSNLY